jgi:hypothetical protein
MIRKGKIGRLPPALREQLNQRLSEGEPNTALVSWLNSLPDVESLLASDSHGQPISESNLSRWKDSGFLDWQTEQTSLDAVGGLLKSTIGLHDDAEGLTARPPASSPPKSPPPCATSTPPKSQPTSFAPGTMNPCYQRHDRNCNCTAIAPKLQENCTRIAPELQQNPSNCTQLQQNHIGVGGGDPQHEANQPGGTAIWRNRVAKPPGPNSVLTSTPPCFRTVDNLSCPG